MVLGATVALWGALVGACVGLFKAKRKPRYVFHVVVCANCDSRPPPTETPATRHRICAHDTSCTRSLIDDAIPHAPTLVWFSDRHPARLATDHMQTTCPLCTIISFWTS